MEWKTQNGDGAMRWETTSNFKSCFVISIQYFSHRFLTFPGHFCFASHCLVIVCRVPLSGKRISVCRTCTEKAVLCYDSFATLLTIFKALHWHIECLAISSAVSAVYGISIWVYSKFIATSSIGKLLHIFRLSDTFWVLKYLFNIPVNEQLIDVVQTTWWLDLPNYLN